MPELTDQGRKIIGDLSNRHGFSTDAIQHMVVSVMNGNGQMAQFCHPEFAGSGQWMSGGMTMIGDMFNNYLKGRIQSLCSDIATILQNERVAFQSGSFQSQSQNGFDSQHQTNGLMSRGSSLFEPDLTQNWWPQELGNPNATGSQNQTQYAYFSPLNRLAVKTGTSVWIYDTLQHQIGGFSQQQGSGGSISFSSQFGTVNLSALPVVSRDGVTLSVPQASVPSAMPSTAPFTVPSLKTPPIMVTNGETNSSTVQGATVSQPIGVDIFAAIEKLGDLKAKGILTDDEFAEKKKELLSRL